MTDKIVRAKWPSQQTYSEFYAIHECLSSSIFFFHWILKFSCWTLWLFRRNDHDVIESSIIITANVHHHEYRIRVHVSIFIIYSFRSNGLGPFSFYSLSLSLSLSDYMRRDVFPFGRMISMDRQWHCKISRSSKFKIKQTMCENEMKTIYIIFFFGPLLHQNTFSVHGIISVNMILMMTQICIFAKFSIRLWERNESIFLT